LHHHKTAWSGGLALTVAAALALPWQARAHDDSCGSEEHEDRLEERERAGQRVSWVDEEHRRRPAPTQHVKLLGFNDFHGQLSPKPVGKRLAGGAAALLSYLRSAQAGIEGETVIIHAGDHVGASPPNSALLQDEPSISVLNLLANRHCRHWFAPVDDDRDEDEREDGEGNLDPRCNVVGTPGNHEFDEGIAELLRLIYGGNHPAGPFLENPWRGARYPMVSANVQWADSHRPVFPPYVIKKAGKERIGVVGAVLRQTPTIVTPSGVAGLEFLDEADAINRYVKQLKRQGIRSIVVTIHQGAFQQSYDGQTSPTAVIKPADGPEILDIISRLDDEVDVVIAGHRHTFSNVLVPNRNGKQVLMVQAFSASTAYDDIDLEIDRRTHDVVMKSAAVVTTWTDVGPGLTPAQDAAAIVAAADARVAPLVSQVIGTASAAITRDESTTGESALGNLIGDAQLAATAGQGAQIAFMNPGGIRADIPAGTTTWGTLFTVQPFGNSLVTMSLTGQQVVDVLEQQWSGGNASAPKVMKTSGIQYNWDASKPAGSRVVVASVKVGGAPIDLGATYRITCNSFLATGGDNFTTFNLGTNRVGGAVDLDALLAYVKSLAQPYGAAIEGRISRLN